MSQIIQYLVICSTSFFVSIITLFSGFGLGTVLMPLFALFFPIPIAIAAVAVVHLLNNLFKVLLVGRFANWSVVLQFGVAAAVASAFGASLLAYISLIPPIFTYTLGIYEFEITAIGLSIGSIIAASSLFELLPRLSKLSFDKKYIPIGGLISGFFGGVSGNQGVFRSAFLIKSGLKKEAFVGTSVVSSTLVDVVRLFIYGLAFQAEAFSFKDFSAIQGLIIAATISAFIGSFIGARLLHNITFKTLQILVGTLLLLIGSLIALGIA